MQPTLTPVPGATSSSPYAAIEPPARHVAAGLIAAAHDAIARVLEGDHPGDYAETLSRAYDDLARAYHLVAGRRIGEPRRSPSPRLDAAWHNDFPRGA